MRYRALAGQGLLIAEMQIHRRRHHSTARLSRQHRQLQAAGEFGAHQSAFDVGGCRVEGLSLRGAFATLVIFEQRGQIGSRRNFRALRFRGGNEFTYRAVGLDQVGFGHADHILRGDAADSVAIQKHQAPVTQRHPLAQVQSDQLGIRHAHFDRPHHPRFRALYFLRRGRLVGQVLHRPQQDLPRLLERLLIAELDRGQDESGIVQLQGRHAGRDSLLVVDQRLVQAARSGAA